MRKATSGLCATQVLGHWYNFNELTPRIDKFNLFYTPQITIELLDGIVEDIFDAGERDVGSAFVDTRLRVFVDDERQRLCVAFFCIFVHSGEPVPPGTATWAQSPQNSAEM